MKFLVNDDSTDPIEVEAYDIDDAITMWLNHEEQQDVFQDMIANGFEVIVEDEYGDKAKFHASVEFVVNSTFKGYQK